MCHSKPVSESAKLVSMKRFNVNSTISELLDSYQYFGFQATNVGKAAKILRQMYEWRLSSEPLTKEEEEELVDVQNNDGTIFSWASPEIRPATRATIFLSFTSNMISCGLRDTFVYLAKQNLVDCIVTTAGGIEEDFIRCFGKFVVGDFHKIKGPKLRADGWNRIGNIYVPNENYVKFESWLLPILDFMLEQQIKLNYNWTPSKMTALMGKIINDESSLYYWCYKNKIPVFCPAITDGSLGDCLYFHYKNKDTKLKIDTIEDIIFMNETARTAKKSGIIILGGGLPKHHVCNANLMKNGADFAVYINTGQEFDGCDSGASPDEAISWGKINSEAQYVKVNSDASIVFPLLLCGVIKNYTDFKKSAIRTSPYYTNYYPNVDIFNLELNH
ncbi:uncharacterized protein LOC142598102 [Dermatophagoides farinae]|uniref:uncharacterized protein LOC142598102 n=1 Tax=Dermatophagoides farinae TaxID=6954 RepID=UPI003F62F217